jgi:hypothetical protein
LSVWSAASARRFSFASRTLREHYGNIACQSGTAERKAVTSLRTPNDGATAKSKSGQCPVLRSAPEGNVMQANIQEIYASTIRPLTSDEKLRIARLILEEVTGGQAPANGVRETPAGNKKLSDLFGAASLGYATGLDNEQIDAGLAREYASTHEDEA